MKTFICSFLFLGLFSLQAHASQELNQLIQCHEALDGKSEGQSNKLSIETPTPILVPSGKKLYFVTQKSIYVTDNTFADKDVVIRLENHPAPFFRKLSFRKNGELGNIDYAEVTSDQKKNAVEPRAALDDKSLSVVKKDLLKRMNSVMGEYQNKYDPQDTLDALLKCRNVSSSELQKSLDKNVAYYEKMARKKKSAGGSYNKSAPGTK
ncbi:hypothetical protein [Bdellovibrio bacteriovorus]|uniref:hypothetical protein n=1 Tax=Bdellovibrio bacteriovorus TaxID=959 RepID=UPI0035A63A56